MKIKDAHCHYGRESLLGTTGRLKISSNNNYKRLSKNWDNYGIEKCVLFPQPMPTSAPRYVLESLPFLSLMSYAGYVGYNALTGRNPETVAQIIGYLSFGAFFAQGFRFRSVLKKGASVNYSEINEQIHRLSDERIEFVPFVSHKTPVKELEQFDVKGIKFYEPHGEMPESLLQYLNSRDMNVVIHLSRRSMFNPSYFLEKVYKNPGINFQVSHLAMGVPEIIYALEEFDNLYLDTSACTHWSHRRLLGTSHRRIIPAFPEKILFGSDEPWTSYKTEIEEIDGLDISDNDKEKIFFRNFEKLWE